ncbi:MAG TPA: HoxN/HupN/NixA family nickel/cobalt transporter, partial [Steroidobacteraceae bacterium]
IQSSVRRRIGAIYAFLVVFTLGVWGWAWLVLRGQPVLLGTAVVAYGLGLRHAVDADHIAAIDNVTRKLMQEGKRPVAVGLFFALGHSSVVLVASAAVALTASALGARSSTLRELGATVGTLASFGFLWLIATVNLLTLRSIWAAFRRARHTGVYEPEDLDTLLVKGGVAARVFRPLFNLMRHSWQMFPLGFLFGLGFETATEVMLLGMSAEQASHGVSLGSILLFPAMFAAGMTLVDMTDGALMMGAYGWAFVKPVRKLYYNIIVTVTSAAVAFLVGGVEALGLISERFGFTGVFWESVASLNSHFAVLGYAIVAVFILCWGVSVIVYRLRRFDEIRVVSSVVQR